MKSIVSKKPAIYAIFLSTLFFAAIFIGCPRVPAPRTPEPEPRPEPLKKIHTIAIFMFEGDYGDVIEKGLFARLNSVNGINPMDASPIIEQRGESLFLLDDPRLLDQFGEFGADSVIYGKIVVKFDDQKGADNVEVKEGIGEFKTKKNRNGISELVEIKRSFLKPIPYIERLASFTLFYSLFDLQTKRKITGGKLVETYDVKFGGQKGLESPDFMLEKLPERKTILTGLSSKIIARLGEIVIAAVRPF